MFTMMVGIAFCRYNGMIIKKLRLVNFGGFEDTTFNFTDSFGTIPLSIFFAPNGFGKSTVLNAIKPVTWDE